jgi:small subunit ribosomal protein S15
MAFTKETKTTIISDYKLHDSDTGSSEVQIALLTNRLNYLTDHFKSHNKDQHSRWGLLRIVSPTKVIRSPQKRRYQPISANYFTSKY